MPERIICEHFSLTDSVRDFVLDAVAEIEERYPKEVDTTIYLIRESSGTFSAEFKVHAFRRDIIGKDNDEEIQNAISRAKKHVLRQMADIKDQKVTERRK